jgi:hypothetical protein
VGDSQTRGVVTGIDDAQTGSDPVDRLCLKLAVDVQVLLRLQRRYICINVKRHLLLSLKPLCTLNSFQGGGLCPPWSLLTNGLSASGLGV